MAVSGCRVHEGESGWLRWSRSRCLRRNVLVMRGCCGM